MSAYWILLPVLLPLIGGCLILFHGVRKERAVCLAAEVTAIATSLAVWIGLLSGIRGSFTVYRFARGFSVTFAVDGMASLFAGMVSVMWPLVLLYAFSYMRGGRRLSLFYGFYVMTYGITLGIAFSANITTLYVFYEMLSLVTIPLVSYYGDHDGMYAGRVYAAFTIGGASLTFFAVVAASLTPGAGQFLYGGSLAGGTALPAGLSVSKETGRIIWQAAFLFGFFGFGTKAAVFPLTYWLPTASVAPTPVTALLHAVAVVNAGAFAVMRLTWYVFGPDILKGSWVQAVCLAAAIVTLVGAAAMALREWKLKRRLAYSTASNLSYMLYGCMLLTPAGFAGALAHMLFHGVIKMTLFLCAGAFLHQSGRSHIWEIDGVGRKMPVTFFCFTVGALSLTGIPLFCGFVSKWQLLTAGVRAGTPLAVAGAAGLIVAAFLCAMYTLTISVRAFFPMKGRDRYADGSEVREADGLMLTPILVFTVVNLVLGFCSGPVMKLVSSIAEGAF